MLPVGTHTTSAPIDSHSPPYGDGDGDSDDDGEDDGDGDGDGDGDDDSNSDGDVLPVGTHTT
jgi:hypothetical protein